MRPHWIDTLQFHFSSNLGIHWTAFISPNSHINLSQDCRYISYSPVYSPGTYIEMFSITKNNNIHIHEVSVALHTLDMKGLIHTNGISPNLACSQPSLTHALAPLSPLVLCTSRLFQQWSGQSATCSIPQPGPTTKLRRDTTGPS